MLRKEIANYVRTYLAQGYDLRSIRNTLTTAGYTIQDIEDSIASVYAGKPKFKFAINKRMIIFGVLGLIILIMIIFVVLKLTQGPAVEPISKPEIKKQQPMVDGPPTQTQPQLPVNLTQPSKPKECIPECKDNDHCTEDVCVEGVCQYQAITPCCGNNRCEGDEDFESCSSDCQTPMTFKESIGSIVNKAADLAKTNSQKAKTICLSLPTTTTVDNCLSTISIIALDALICEEIYSEYAKDLCYTDIAIEKEEFSLCPKIKDRWLKNSCTTFQRLQISI